MTLSLLFIGLVQWQELRQNPKQELFTELNFQSALHKAQESDKLCLMYFETDYCFPCESFLNQAWNNPELREILQGEYISIGVNHISGMAKSGDLMRQFGIESFPTLLITDSEGNEMQRFTNLDQYPKLAPELIKLNRLRVAPDSFQPATSEEVWDQATPYLRGIGETLTPEDFKNKLGVSMYRTDDYQIALHQADLISKAWNKGIWIQSNGKGSYDIIIGTFSSRKEARITTKYLNKKGYGTTKIVSLDSKDVRF
ncbi:MAG: thioredoxin family protein [Bacteroidota bacterium]